MTAADGAPRFSLDARKVLLIIHSVTILFFVAAVTVAPVIVDRIHVDDTVLLANIAWRGVNGLAPAIDYPHFYGGFTESFVTASFGMFGVAYKSIDYAFVLLFGFTALIGCALCGRRLSLTEFGLLIALGAALILSLSPLEVSSVFQVAHSFVYNHVGVVLMLALTVFSCIGLEDRRTERISSFIAGVALYILILVKTTFGLIGPSIILACLLQRRWASAGLVCVGAAAAMLAIDPGMHRAWGSLEILMASDAAGQAGGYEGRIREALLMLQSQAVPVVICLLLSVYLLRHRKSGGLSMIGSLLICGLGYGAAMLATGGSPEQKLLPFLIVASLLLSRTLIGAGVHEGGRYRSLLIRSVPVVLGYALILPAAATAGFGFLQAIGNADDPLVTEGPLSRYVVFDPAAVDKGEQGLPAEGRLAAATSDSLGRVWAGEVTDRDEYVMLADGVELLRRFPNASSYGIISNGRMFDFTAPLESKIVPSFPVWPTSASVEMMKKERFEPDVDLVMILDEVPELELVTGALRARMGQEFRPCRRSAFWTLYVRRSVPMASCGSAASQEAVVLPTEQHGIPSSSR